MKIGILTMHKVLNYGSALQAYALQHYISKLGYDAELIDYIFPNGCRKKKFSFKQKLLSPLKKIVSGTFVKEHRFKDFYKRYFVCSKEQYNSPEELANAKFEYDILMTGSDQVWNPIHIKDDFSFFLPFAPESVKKVSYASSFSVSNLDNDVRNIVERYLKSFSNISVREESGVKMIENILGRSATHACDPTLLLSEDDWTTLIGEKPFYNKEPYILVYILTYAYNPYPEIDSIIDAVQKKLGLHLIILDGSLNDFKRKNATVIKNAGPIEFLSLVKHASFVITTSFHGTAFALNFAKPFYSVIKDYSGFDDRMIDLLKRTGNIERAIIYNKGINNMDNIIPSKTDLTRLITFRQNSQQYLKDILMS